MEPMQKAESAASALEKEINEDIHPLLKKITDHIRIIGTVIGIIVLAAALYTGVGLYKNHTLNQARERINTIAELPDQEELDALGAYVADAPETMRQGIRLRMAELAMQLERYDRAVQAWDEVAANGARDMQIIANLGKAKALRLSGDPGGAVAVLQTMLSRSPGDFRGSVTFELAAAAEEAEQWDQALNAYRELKTVSSNTNQDFLDHKIVQLQNRIAANAS